MFNLFNKTAINKTIFFVSADILLIAISVLSAFLIRFDGQIPLQYFPFISRIIILAIIFTIPIFYFQGLYSFSWSYVSTSEAISLLKATTISFLFLGITIFISKYFPSFKNFPRSILFISYLLVFIFCGGIRISKRVYLHVVGSTRISKKEKTLIIGAGDAGEQILRSIISSKVSPYYPIGLIDDSSIKQGVSIHGYKVLGKITDIPEIIKSYEVKELIVALPSAGKSTIKKVVELGGKAGLKKIKIAPALSEVISGKVSFKNLKDIDVEDLLGREEVNLDTKQIKNFIKDKIILVTGAAGSIGSELSRQTAKFNPSLLLLLDQDETGIFNISKELEDDFSNLKIQPIIADIRDKEKINEIFRKFQPKIVFHAAAYKHVTLMEENPDEAVKNNIFGTENLANISLNNGVEKFIFISTDKAVNPTSVMGTTKRVSEMICQSYNQKNQTKFISVRFGNVLNSRGSVIPIFREQIKRGGPVQVTHRDMKRYFMLTSEACLLVMQSGAMGQGGEVFVLDMGKPIKIWDLAKEMIKLSGFEPDKDIAIVFTGMRQGEKLFEEILTAEEGTIATQNQKIFVAKLSAIEPENLKRKLENIKNLINNQDKTKITKDLKDIILHYSQK
ncbi:MAG: polysaccharide biosynthesis protein [Candidatus Staskawiczbacteria bacterium]|nr:polysaccharide biosynthesis protein [Candidatus Staskawiczbacteria bacterium]